MWKQHIWGIVSISSYGDLLEVVVMVVVGMWTIIYFLYQDVCQEPCSLSLGCRIHLSAAADSQTSNFKSHFCWRIVKKKEGCYA